MKSKRVWWEGRHVCVGGVDDVGLGTMSVQVSGFRGWEFGVRLCGRS